MNWLTKMNAILSRWVMYLACLCLVGLLAVVLYGVVLRYVFNAAPAYVEQVALLLVVSVAMFGAAAGVRDAGHIGLDSLVRTLPPKVQRGCKLVVFVLTIGFSLALLAGSAEMALSTHKDSIPTLGISESVRYLPVLISGVLITLFTLEHMLAQFAGYEGPALMALTLLSVAFLVFLLLGMPVAFAIGLSCLLTFAFEGLPFETAIQMMVSGMNVFSFLAIPFFIFSGELMLHGGIADKIVPSRAAWSATEGRAGPGQRGGLHAVRRRLRLAGGRHLGDGRGDDPDHEEGGLQRRLRCPTWTTHASLSGALMPTSHNMIIYAFAAQAAVGTIDGHAIRGVSIGDLMFAGLIPCFWIMVCMLVTAYWQARKYGFPKRPDGTTMIEKFPGWGQVLRSSWPPSRACWWS